MVSVPIKLSDDAAVVGWIRGGEETKYMTTVSNFVICHEQNHLQLSVTKTNDLVVDLRKTKAPMTPVSIHTREIPESSH